MKKSLIIVYSILFAVMGWLFLTSGANAINDSVPSVSERFIVGTDYNLIANKIFKKFIAKYPNFLDKVECNDIDGYVNKVLNKTKIKFRKPDINKENKVKGIFKNLLRDYIEDNLQCDDFIDVDWYEDETTEEYVKCLFNDGKDKTTQSCSSTDGKRACKGIGSCSIKIDGTVGENITWKSSCGGYAYTTIDGENEYAKFNCQLLDTDTEPSNAYYRGVAYQCNDGTQKKLRDKTSCKSYSTRKKYVYDFCSNGSGILSLEPVDNCTPKN